MNQEHTSATTVPNVWELTRKQKKVIAKQSFNNFLERMNQKTFEEKQNLPKHDIVLFYGRAGKIDYYFRENELTINTFEEYITKLLEQSGPKLLEITIPAVIKNFPNNIQGVKVTSQ